MADPSDDRPIRILSDGTPDGTRVMVGDVELPDCITGIEWSMRAPDFECKVVLTLTGKPSIIDRKAVYRLHAALDALPEQVSVVIEGATLEEPPPVYREFPQADLVKVTDFEAIHPGISRVRSEPQPEPVRWTCAACMVSNPPNTVTCEGCGEGHPDA